VQEGFQQIIGVREGEILFGKYRVDKLLGVGGMGAVVSAHHLQLDTPVAIKFLLPDTLKHEEAVARFAREARAAVLMNNEHVARIFDVGTLANGAPYMVMEFLDGDDLGALLQSKGPFPVAEAVDFVLQACEAVAEAHVLGVVHRDLKPANLFCIKRPDGRRSIKVLDFGISKVTGSAWSAPDASLTSAAAVMGTPLYMSPEQLEAPQSVDARTDIWALGIILYELLTGKMPFFGNTLPQVSVKIAVRAPPPLREYRPDAPDELAAVIDKCLEKEREKRFANVAELAHALLPFGPKRARVSVERIAEISEAAGMTAAELEAALAPAPSSIEPTSRPAVPESTAPAFFGTEPTAEELTEFRRSSRGPLRTILAVALVLALALLVTFRVVSRKTVDAASGPSAAAAPRAAEGEGPPSEPRMNAASAPAPAPVALTSASAAASAPPLPSKVTTTVRPSGWKPPVRSPAAGKAKADCDPNYDLDEHGRKHFKPECFVNAP
jgi:serine/threonine-protein kinase